jgi:hypothetical protein
MLKSMIIFKRLGVQTHLIIGAKKESVDSKEICKYVYIGIDCDDIPLYPL